MKHIILIFIITGVILLLCGFTLYSTTWLTVPVCIVDSPKITGKPLRIVQLSDLHKASFGKKNARLIDKVKSLTPDIICFTGDLIDTSTTNTIPTLALAAALLKIAPLFVVSGNHEFAHIGQERFFSDLTLLGAQVLDNQLLPYKIHGQDIRIAGFRDTHFYNTHANPAQAIEADISALLQPADPQRLLLVLTHSPEYFPAMATAAADVVLAGHTHGGLFRLPFIGGIYLQHKDYIPRYDTGRYSEKNATMFVSKGLGTSGIPFRFGNFPEIVFVLIK